MSVLSETAFSTTFHLTRWLGTAHQTNYLSDMFCDTRINFPSILSIDRLAQLVRAWC